MSILCTETTVMAVRQEDSYLIILQ